MNDHTNEGPGPRVHDTEEQSHPGSHICWAKRGGGGGGVITQNT